MDNGSEEIYIIPNTIVEGQLVAEKLKCIICYNLPYLPKYLSCCEQIICLSCINECLKMKKQCPFCKNNNPNFSEPNKFVMRTFDEVIMKCKFTDCDEKMSYTNILDHENKCPKNLNPKPLPIKKYDFYLKYHEY